EGGERVEGRAGSPGHEANGHERMMRMKVLVTGGAGYVGSACLRYMLENGHEAIAYDNLSQGHAAAVPGGADGGTFILGDILDTAGMVELMRRFKPDAVMHFAAATYVAESVKDPEFHYRNNVAG